MGSINGVKKSRNTKQSDNRIVVSVPVLILILGIIVVITIVALYAASKVIVDDKAEVDSEHSEMQSKVIGVYKAIKDIDIDGEISEIVYIEKVPMEAVTADMFNEADDISLLRASKLIKANDIITSDNTYNPINQDIVLDTSRQVMVDCIKATGIEVGDYIDIRLKYYVNGEYKDEVVCAKREVLAKEGDTISLMLSEVEILNLNNAIMDVDTDKKGTSSEIYATKYIDVVNQPKANVTYYGSGTRYAEKELAEAR